MDPAAAKQQIAERVKQANKFLVTVNANPTVDQLAACIGLTLLLNRLGKHATAVFSGKVPSTIEFLQPEKTLQSNTDSLRDFIISLDKNKADKLRYKVEDDVVRIFITPYRTSLSEKDLVFSQGDYNVEVVIALGVTQRTQLDSAITAHGRILHDATVISVNVGPGKAPDIGQINWQDATASSLSEMLVSISESFGPGLIDSQMATAFLTGIVAETQRFSNKKTSPKVMTMSAQLMAAGANQQLIVSKLEPPPPPASPNKPVQPNKPSPQPLKPEGIIDVPHDDSGKVAKQDSGPGATEIHIDDQGNLRVNPEQELAVEPQSEPIADNPHAFLGQTAEPLGVGAPITATPQPEWAAPYDLVPMDPVEQAGAGSSEFGSTAAPADPEALQGNFSQVRTVQPPTSVAPLPLNNTLDSARSAVDTAIASAPFDPAWSAPVQALNAQPATAEPIHAAEASASVPDVPPAAVNDTPMLALPKNNIGPVMNTAPPPVPPPLMPSPGVVIPSPPSQYQ